MVAPKRNDVIIDYAIIEAGCSDNSDNPDVCIKGVWISKGLLYMQKRCLDAHDPAIRSSYTINLL